MRSSNLQFMRFIAAIMVIFSHSFSLTQGDNSKEWLVQLTHGQITMGGLAVSIFFLCGGYLCTKSVGKYDHFSKYVFSRLIRIIPSLAFVVVSCILMGSLITSMDRAEYFCSIDTYKYLLNAIMIPQHNLPGVFEHAKYVPTVNGALWTLPVEFLCYIMGYLLYKMGLISKKIWITIPATILLIGFASNIGIGFEIIRPIIMFYIGTIYYVYKGNEDKKRRYVIVAFILLFISNYFGVLNIGVILFLPYLLITFWFGEKQYFKKCYVLGDYSYTIYLWGFPIQQLVAELCGWNLSPYKDTLISIPIVMILSMITYYTIEQPSIKLAQKIKKE